MNLIKEYQINTPGHSQGINNAIPTSFRVVVTDVNIGSNPDGSEDTHILECQVCTFQDAAKVTPVTNDNVPTRFAKGIDVAGLSDDPKTLVEDHFRVDILDVAYTAAKVQVIV